MPDIKEDGSEELEIAWSLIELKCDEREDIEEYIANHLGVDIVELEDLFSGYTFDKEALSKNEGFEVALIFMELGYNLRGYRKEFRDG